MVQRESRSPWLDFVHRMVVGLAVACLVWGVIPALGALMDSRAVRDVRGVTPFHDVRILTVDATAMTITLTGTLVKSRDCVTVGNAQAWVERDGQLFPAAFEVLESAATPASRPVSPLPQAWGPWRITSPVAWPDRAMMFRSHDCDGDVQSNEVFNMAWPKEGK